MRYFPSGSFSGGKTTGTGVDGDPSAFTSYTVLPDGNSSIRATKVHHFTHVRLPPQVVLSSANASVLGIDTVRRNVGVVAPEHPESDPSAAASAASRIALTLDFGVSSA